MTNIKEEVDQEEENSEDDAPEEGNPRERPRLWVQRPEREEESTSSDSESKDESSDESSVDSDDLAVGIDPDPLLSPSGTIEEKLRDAESDVSWNHFLEDLLNPEVKEEETAQEQEQLPEAGQPSQDNQSAGTSEQNSQCSQRPADQPPDPTNRTSISPQELIRAYQQNRLVNQSTQTHTPLAQCSQAVGTFSRPLQQLQMMIQNDQMNPQPEELNDSLKQFFNDFHQQMRNNSSQLMQLFANRSTQPIYSTRRQWRRWFTGDHRAPQSFARSEQGLRRFLRAAQASPSDLQTARPKLSGVEAVQRLALLYQTDRPSLPIIGGRPEALFPWVDQPRWPRYLVERPPALPFQSGQLIRRFLPPAQHLRPTPASAANRRTQGDQDENEAPDDYPAEQPVQRFVRTRQPNQHPFPRRNQR